MSWERADHKHYRGKIYRIYISAVEKWAAEHFIDQYLISRGFILTDENRDTLAAHMERYLGDAPVLRKHLASFLDRRLGAACQRPIEDEGPW